MKTTKIIFVLILSTFIISLFTFSISRNEVFAETTKGMNVGQKAPSFKLLTVDGKKLDLESFRKDKTVLLVFGATWCPSCKHEVPFLKGYYDRFKSDGLKVLNVDIQESQKKVSSFVDKNNISYPVVLDEKADVAILYEIRGIPLNILLDKDGVIRYRDNELPDIDDVKKLLVN